MLSTGYAASPTAPLSVPITATVKHINQQNLTLALYNDGLPATELNFENYYLYSLTTWWTWNAKTDNQILTYRDRSVLEIKPATPTDDIQQVPSLKLILAQHNQYMARKSRSSNHCISFE